ncbi:type III-B CRISPR module RAMP protein Cmr6 [Nocardiopsis valliformis]|uniref:type III-B CRISPR module RAMP protein Cmr6 n=1 Tax=Nocardiopsis valliformis TaxID=239974 RepID=UPI00034B2C4C|nr:type III-B CRISPR module RAMP protein Cmr6 [Nocardiopsis valliformis]
MEHETRENQDPSASLQEKRGEWESVSPEANGLVVLRRLSFEPLDGSTNPWKNHVPLHAWAVESRIGQGDAELLRRTLERRRRFLRQWVSTDPDRRHVLRVCLTVEWRLVSGLGLQLGVLDNGLALHGTYGWPTLPAASLKGLAAAGARSAGADTERVIRALGGPRPRFGKEPRPAREDQGRGSVRFLDALPGEDGVKVHADVITPHQHPYYTSTDRKAHENSQVRQDLQYPGEHHNPVPLPFLSVSGDLRVDLVGDDPDDLDAVFDWLAEAGEELGGGGRTTAGYGYFSCSRVNEEEA